MLGIHTENPDDYDEVYNIAEQSFVTIQFFDSTKDSQRCMVKELETGYLSTVKAVVDIE